MTNKAAMQRALDVYDGVIGNNSKGVIRRAIKGDNQPIEYLRAFLALPKIQLLSADAEISLELFKAELRRIGADYHTIYTAEFLRGTNKSSQLFNSLFPEMLTLSAVGPHEAELSADTQSFSPTDIIETIETLRDKLITYLARVSSQPWFHSFAAEYLPCRLSGPTGIRRAQNYLAIVTQALDEFRASGILRPLVTEFYRAGFGDNTFDLTQSTVARLMEITQSLLNFETLAFRSSRVHERISASAEVITSRTECSVVIRTTNADGSQNLHKLEGSFDCYMNHTWFTLFLEEYLYKKRFSFQSGAPFPAEDFLEKFRRHLSCLVVQQKAEKDHHIETGHMVEAMHTVLA